LPLPQRQLEADCEKRDTLSAGTCYHIISVC
jgi:hypothetical protein